jgi:hypothetical protein
VKAEDRIQLCVAATMEARPMEAEPLTVESQVERYRIPKTVAPGIGAL